MTKVPELLFVLGAVANMLLFSLICTADELYTFDPATADYELYANRFGIATDPGNTLGARSCLEALVGIRLM
jgi:hypothetical protein